MAAEEREQRWYATGKRKTAVARVWLKAGTGNIAVNRRGFETYFPRETSRLVVMQPFEVTEQVGRFDVFATLAGESAATASGLLAEPPVTVVRAAVFVRARSGVLRRPQLRGAPRSDAESDRPYSCGRGGTIRSGSQVSASSRPVVVPD